MLGVVVPTLDEAASLPPLLDDLRALKIPYSVLIADGGSADETARIAREAGASTLRTQTGRARQMNAGAALLRTPWLLFLHADSRLSPGALREIERHVFRGDESAAHFKFAVQGRGFLFRVLEVGQRIRGRIFKLVYGDQGLLIPSRVFDEVGGFPDEPLMEDLILTRRLQSRGRLRALDAPLRTSPRRYLEAGGIRTVLRNTLNLVRFSLGTSPQALAAGYPTRRAAVAGDGGSPLDAPSQTLLVFAKAPREGFVKTRLARDVGDHNAAYLYRHMARGVVSQVVQGPAPVVVCYDPIDGEQDVRDLLGDIPREFVYQGAGDLGQRMCRMMNRALGEADRVVIIGTDAPSVDRGTIERAFSALDTADLVIGPAVDGGYYLIGLKRQAPGLFADIEWSSPLVLAATIGRAEQLGLGVTYLDIESDVDTIHDLTPELRAVLAERAGKNAEAALPRTD